MKKNILNNIKIIAFGIFLAIGASYVYAGTYTPPSGVAPANNTDIPITVGSQDQDKRAGLSVETFNARGNGWLKGQTFIQGNIRGGLPTDVDSQVVFGDSSHDVTVEVKSNVDAEGYLQSASLADHPEASADVCADSNGKLILCDL